MVERRRAAVRQSARGFKDRLMGVADTATSRVGDTAGSVGSAVGAAGSVGESIGHAPAATLQAAQGNPLAVGLVAFGAGAVLAALLPDEREGASPHHRAGPARPRRRQPRRPAPSPSTPPRSSSRRPRRRPRP